MREGRGSWSYHSSEPYSGDRICTKIDLSSRCGSYKFLFITTFFSPRKEIRIPLQSMRVGYGNKPSIIVTLAKHTDHQNRSWIVIRIVILFFSYCQVPAGISCCRLPLLTWLIDGCRQGHCVARLASEVTCGRLPPAWLIDGLGR